MNRVLIWSKPSLYMAETEPSSRTEGKAVKKGNLAF